MVPGTPGLSPKAQDRRRQIIEAAEKIFSQKGFHGAKVEEIAVEAGVGKGTVYEYFSSKAHLYQETIRHYVNSYMESLKAVLDQEQSTREQLTDIMKLHRHFLTDKQWVFKFAPEHPPLGAEMREWLCQKKREVLKLLTELLARGIERGEIRPLNTMTAAQIFLGVLLSLGEQILLAPTTASGDEKIQEAVEIIFQGLAQQP